MKKIAILGCGQLGSIVADAIASGLLPGYTLCAATVSYTHLNKRV